MAKYFAVRFLVNENNDLDPNGEMSEWVPANLDTLIGFLQMVNEDEDLNPIKEELAIFDVWEAMNLESDEDGKWGEILCCPQNIILELAQCIVNEVQDGAESH